MQASRAGWLHYEGLCAESSATSGIVRRSASSSTRCAGWSTAGYDSAGRRAARRRGGLTVRRQAGRLANLEAALAEAEPTAPRRHHRHGPHPLGHPRRPTDRNAHPHRDAAGKIAVVHNGIIENFAALRAELEAAGVEFASDTDTEVAVHLVAAAVPPRADRGRLRRPPCWPCCAGWRAHFTLVVRQRRRPGHDRRGAPAPRRWWSASATARCSSAPTSRRSSSTPARPSNSARTRPS